MESESRAKFIDALSSIECLDSELEDIAHMQCLLDEGLTDDVGPILRGESWGGKYLQGRWPLHLSMLNTIHYRVTDILGNLQEGIREGYEAIGTRT